MKKQLSFSFLFFLLILFACQQAAEQAASEKTARQEATHETRSRSLSMTENDSARRAEINNCNWDHDISQTEYIVAKWMWDHKWGNLSMPRAAYIDKKTLTSLAEENCGFRMYYGLSKPGDITSMGVSITWVDSDFWDGTLYSPDSMLYVSFYEREWFNQPIKKVSYETASEYTTNWERYHGICDESIVLGKNACCEVDSSCDKDFAGAKGIYGDTTVQLVPISHAFAANEVMDILNKGYDGIRLENIMIPTGKPKAIHRNHFTGEEIKKADTLEYDLLIHFIKLKEDGYGGWEEESEYIEGGMDSYALDRTCPCPSVLPCCNPAD